MPRFARIAALLSIALGFPGFAPASESPPPSPQLPAPAALEIAALEIAVDPRIELIAAVSYLAGGRDGWSPRSESPYREAMKAWAEPHRKHPAVARLRAIEGFAYSYPAQAIVHFGPPPAFEPIAPVPQDAIDAIGGPRAMEAWVRSLREFARDTRYMNFYRSQQPRFDAMVARARATLGEVDIVGPFERFYGLSPQRYSVILAPNILAGAFGPNVALPDGRRHFYNIQGAAGLVDGVLDFGQAASIASLGWHEFGHTVVNPLDAAQSTKLEASASLYAPIAEEMRAAAYPNWEIAANEALVRANVLHLCRTVFVVDAAITCIESQLTGSAVFDGYVYRIADFRIAYYERFRAKWPTYADFHPIDLQILGALAASRRTP